MVMLEISKLYFIKDVYVIVLCIVYYICVCICMLIYIIENIYYDDI